MKYLINKLFYDRNNMQPNRFNYFIINTLIISPLLSEPVGGLEGLVLYRGAGQCPVLESGG